MQKNQNFPQNSFKCNFEVLLCAFSFSFSRFSVFSSPCFLFLSLNLPLPLPIRPSAAAFPPFSAFKEGPPGFSVFKRRKACYNFIIPLHILPIQTHIRRYFEMKLIWNGHSCFTLATEAGTLVIDPYEDGSVPGLSPSIWRLTPSIAATSTGTTATGPRWPSAGSPVPWRWKSWPPGTTRFRAPSGARTPCASFPPRGFGWPI